MLPWQSTTDGVGVFISLWAFAVPLEASPPIVGTRGVIRTFSWGGQDFGTPATARALDVAASTSGGSFSFSVDGVASNDVDVVVNGRVVARAPATPQLVPWLPNSNSVLIVAENFGSGRLVTPQGEPLPPASFTCERADEALREVAMRCEVVRRGPLEPTGFSGSSVRATVDTPSGPMVTAEVRLP